MSASPVSYQRLASIAFPLVTLVLGLFVFLDVGARSRACPARPEGAGAVVAPAVPSAPAAPVAAPVAAPASSEKVQAVFDSIYRDVTWGGNGKPAGTSGSGSTLRSTLLYRTFLEQFMKDHDIHSVVDAGCGDWEFSQAIDWTGIDYKGYDIVESVIAADTAKYTKPNVHFFTANIVDADLPSADLLIVKHVLQHLPNAEVAKFLAQLPKYKHVLLINGVTPVSMSARNIDITWDEIKQGGYRNLDVTKPPFNVVGDKPMTYWNNGHMHQIVHVAKDPGYQVNQP